MDLKIVVATHKEYDLKEDDRYLPVFVGSKISDLTLPYQRDDEGDNISEKNPYYCELTGLYWAYKNLKADYLGLCHYRRYFDLDNIDLNKYDIVLPKKRHYYIETVYDQFKHAHGERPLKIMEEVIKNDYPAYYDDYLKQLNSKSLHIYNMFIMKYDIFIDYCDFLFGVLDKVEKQLGEVNRIYGFLAERLLDVYINKNHYDYQEVRIINMERTNWPKKIYNFLMRKIKG